MDYNYCPLTNPDDVYPQKMCHNQIYFEAFLVMLMQNHIISKEILYKVGIFEYPDFHLLQRHNFLPDFDQIIRMLELANKQYQMNENYQIVLYCHVMIIYLNLEYRQNLEDVYVVDILNLN